MEPADPRKIAIQNEARRLGFDAVGFARADVPLDTDHAHYLKFVQEGMHGDMSFLAEHAEARRTLDADSILLGAKTVICLARSYRRSREDEASDPPFAKKIARYARGKDYHAFVRRKLRKLAEFVRKVEPGVEARPTSDTAPILERAWAARSGIGFVGKNGLVIVPGTGSMLLLGEIVTTLDVPADTPMTERCGTCTRCLDACPTKAFPKPFVLDPRKCISYWTIEARSPMPEEIRARLGDHLFGCDDCQTVCPFNAAKAQRAENAAPFQPLERWNETSLETIATLREEEWEDFSRGTPLRRATFEGLKANAESALREETGGPKTGT